MLPPAPTPPLRTPDRGRQITPAWFAFRQDGTGWHCDHPHPSPDVPTSATGLPNGTSHGVDHLNEHHPGWKLPCSRCGTPQWNAEGRPTCFQCRR